MRFCQLAGNLARALLNDLARTTRYMRLLLLTATILPNLTPRELRRPFFQKRADPFAMIGRLAAAPTGFRFPVEQRAKVDRGREVHVLLHVPIAGQRSLCDPRRYGSSFSGEDFGLHYPVDQA